MLLPPLPPSPYYTLRPHSGEVTAVKYVNLADSKVSLVSGTSSGQLRVWDMSTYRPIWEEQCDSSLLSINAHPGTQGKFISQCRSGTVETWNIGQQKKETSYNIVNPGFCRLATLQNQVEGMAVSPATINYSCVVAAHSEPDKINIYDLSQQQLVSTLEVKDSKPKGACMCVAAYCEVSSGVVHVLGGFEDGSVIDWDSRNNSKELSSLKLFTEPVMCMAYNLKRKCGVCGSPLSTLETFSSSPDTGELQKKFTVRIKNAGVSDIAISSDCRTFLSGGWDGRIRMYTFKGKCLAIMNYHTENVHSVTFANSSSPDDSYTFASGSKDGRITLWMLY